MASGEGQLLLVCVCMYLSGKDKYLLIFIIIYLKSYLTIN